MLSRFSTILFCLALLSSCGKRTESQSSYLSKEQEKALEMAFARLDLALKQNAPNIHEHLKDGADIQELDNLRTNLSGNKVEMLETWFEWCNGSDEYLLPAGLPISIKQTVEDLRIVQSIPYVPEIRRNSVKILCDSAGDGYFMDVNTESPLVFHHMLEDPDNPIWYGTLPEFLGFIASAFESGVIYQNEEGHFDYDEAKYEEMMADYIATATRG